MEKASVWQKLVATLDNTSKGYSARKITAFAIIICDIFAHIAWIKRAFMQDNFSLMEGILGIDYAFVAALLGMTTYERLKNGKTTGGDTNTATTNGTAPQNTGEADLNNEATKTT